MNIQKFFYSSISLVTLFGIAFIGMQGCQRASKTEDATFEPAECATVAPYSEKKLPTPKAVKGAKCGYLVVPENRQKPKGPHIKLPVMVLPAQRRHA